ncbi:alpha/beta hydrolase [Thermodesulfobacteriota bacterium]
MPSKETKEDARTGMVGAPREMRGTLKRYEHFPSRFVTPRHVDVWLPPGHDSSSTRYPVLYMHDGQNLFDPATSFTGVTWGIDEAMGTLGDAGTISLAIVVGIWNTVDRTREYMPEKPCAEYVSAEQRNALAGFYGTPMSDRYLRFVVEEAKAFVDAAYKTRTGRGFTFIMGSSMGALVSLYAVCRYPDVFGGAACLSTHWPAGQGMMVRYLKDSLPNFSTHKFYFDHGTENLDAQYETYQQEADAVFKEAGYVEERNWMSRKLPGHDHSETYWKQRAPDAWAFLLGRGSRQAGHVCLVSVCRCLNP